MNTLKYKSRMLALNTAFLLLFLCACNAQTENKTSGVSQTHLQKAGTPPAHNSGGNQNGGDPQEKTLENPTEPQQNVPTESENKTSETSQTHHQNAETPTTQNSQGNQNGGDPQEGTLECRTDPRQNDSTGSENKTSEMSQTHHQNAETPPAQNSGGNQNGEDTQEGALESRNEPRQNDSVESENQTSEMSQTHHQKAGTPPAQNSGGNQNGEVIQEGNLESPTDPHQNDSAESKAEHFSQKDTESKEEKLTPQNHGVGQLENHENRKNGDLGRREENLSFDKNTDGTENYQKEPFNPQVFKGKLKLVGFEAEANSTPFVKNLMRALVSGNHLPGGRLGRLFPSSPLWKNQRKKEMEEMITDKLEMVLNFEEENQRKLIITYVYNKYYPRNSESWIYRLGLLSTIGSLNEESISLTLGRNTVIHPEKPDESEETTIELLVRQFAKSRKKPDVLMMEWFDFLNGSYTFSTSQNDEGQEEIHFTKANSQQRNILKFIPYFEESEGDSTSQ